MSVFSLPPSPPAALVETTIFCTPDELRGLKDEYLSATAEGKRFMEQRFGKKVIQNAVDESLSTDWLSENCKSCPRCGTNIQVGLTPLIRNISHLKPDLI